MTPGGAVLNRYPVGDGPTSVATGPDDRVWVSVTGANKLVWFDAKSATPTSHDVAVGGGGCGPVAIVAGGDQPDVLLQAGLCHAGARHSRSGR